MKSNNMLLVYQWVKYITSDIRKYFEMNEIKQIINTCVMQLNQGLKLQFIARNSFIKKKDIKSIT